MERNTKVALLMTRKKVKVNFSGLMDALLLESGKMESNMESARYSTKKGSVELESGTKARKFDGLTKSKARQPKNKFEPKYQFLNFEIY
jgi:hypothetical protein